jgi:hypothetical protein
MLGNLDIYETHSAHKITYLKLRNVNYNGKKPNIAGKYEIPCSCLYRLYFIVARKKHSNKIDCIICISNFEVECRIIVLVLLSVGIMKGHEYIFWLFD